MDMNEGQEKHTGQLEGLVRRIQELEKDNEQLRARTEGVIAAIGRAYDTAFNCPTKSS